MSVANVELETYLVADDGTIQFPVLGTVKVEGYSNQELSLKLKEMLKEYVQDPIVNVRILNFQVSVLGEVRSPGTFNIQDDHLSLNQSTWSGRRYSAFRKKNQCASNAGAG